MTSRRGILIVLTALFGALFVTGCDGLVSDPNFHTWCGDQLCAWKLEAGHIQRAPTWNTKDYGVEMLDTPTTISQHIDATPKCLEFTTVADVAVEAQVSVGVDFDDDGTIDYEQPVVASGFTEQRTQITAPALYSNFRLFITKRGTGHAVLAQLDIDDKGDCTAAPAKLMPQIQGTACSPLGGGAECRSGVCCEGLCSECCVGSSANSETCTGGTKCGVIPALAINFTPHRGIPHQCDPGKLKREKGKECLLDADCASGKCPGAVWVVKSIEDGGTCPQGPSNDGTCDVESVRAGVCE